MWNYDFHEARPVEGLVRSQGNPAHIMERGRVPLCFDKPHYNPIVWGPLKVLKQPIRLTKQHFDDRGNEVCAHGSRRLKEQRRLKNEYKDRIRVYNERKKTEEQERQNEPMQKMRWWHTRETVEHRDLLKTMRFNNTFFAPELLLNAKDIVNCFIVGVKLGDDHMRWVSTFIMQNQTLRRLSLEGNKITEDGVANLRPGLTESRSLTALDISFNPIGDAGLNHLVSAFTENHRFTKIEKLNVGTCNLSPNSTFHISRLIRDFKSMREILAWRNRLGNPSSGAIEGAGIASVLDTLHDSKTIRLLDLTANNLSEEVCHMHATVKEQQARQKRIQNIEKRNLGRRIETMMQDIERRKAVAVWEDELIVIAQMENQLATERAKYRTQLEEEARERKSHMKENEWRDRLLHRTGRKLIDVEHRCRLVLTGNHSVQPSTLSRLSAFYDIVAVPYEKWARRPRKYDELVKPRRELGQEYTFRTAEEAAEDDFTPFCFEDELELKERLEREEREREMEELRRKGEDVSKVLEERFSKRREEEEAALDPLNATGTDSVLHGSSAHGSSVPATPKSARASNITAASPSNTALASPAVNLALNDSSPYNAIDNIDTDDDGLIWSESDSKTNDGRRQKRQARRKGGNKKSGDQRMAVGVSVADVEAREAKRAQTRVTRDDDEIDQFDGLLDDDNDRFASTMSGAGLFEQQVQSLLNQEEQLEEAARAQVERREARQEALRKVVEERFTANLDRVFELAEADGEDGEDGPKITSGEDGKLVINEASLNNSAKHADNEADPESTRMENLSNVLLKEGLSTLAQFWATIRQLGEVGSPSQDDMDRLEEEKRRAATFKSDLATQLTDLPESAQPSSDDHVDAIADVVEEILKETDRTESNNELLHAVLTKVSVDWPTLMESRGWLTLAASDGSMDFVRSLLACDGARFDTLELISASFFNQEVRIPLSYLVLTHPSVDISSVAEDLQDMWQEFFEDICSSKRAIPKENRDQRMELIEFMLSNETLQLNCDTAEGGDGQTVFTRACYEGDVDLVVKLTSHDKVGDINRVKDSDQTTGLMQAVLSDNPDMVQVLLLNNEDTIDVNIEAENGNALDLAILLKRDEQIVEMLTEAGATRSEKSTGKKKKKAKAKKNTDYDTDASMNSSQGGSSPGSQASRDARKARKEARNARRR